MSYEAEMPGTRVTVEQLRVICSRYYFAARFVKGKDVLEVGCGPGIGLGYLAEGARRVIGGDYAEDNLKVAWQHYSNKLELVHLDAHHLPFKKSSFDTIVAMATVAYLRVDRFFEECYRVLKKGGVLVFCTPNKNQPGFQRSLLSLDYFSIPELSLLLGRHFNAEFFGAFPVPGTAQRTITRYTNAAVSGINRVLSAIPRGSGVRDFVSRSILRESALSLAHEIKDGMIEDIKPVSIRADAPDFEHKVIYVVARVR
jgi:SAM-dependent methyltransferase